MQVHTSLRSGSNHFEEQIIKNFVFLFNGQKKAQKGHKELWIGKLSTGKKECLWHEQNVALKTLALELLVEVKTKGAFFPSKILIPTFSVFQLVLELSS